MEVKKRSESIPGIERVFVFFFFNINVVSTKNVCMFERQGDTDRQKHREGRWKD